MSDNGIIYLLRDDLIWKEGVYKIGRSSNWNSRKASYGDVRVLSMFETKCISLVEKYLITLFTKKWKVAKGKEFFLCGEERDVLEMFVSFEKETKENIKDIEKLHSFQNFLPFPCSDDVKLDKKGQSKRDKELKELLDTSKVPEKDVDVLCNSPKIHDKHQLEYLCNLKDRTKEESYSIKKYIIASRLEVEQEDVTPEFFATYKDQVKQYRNLKIAFSGTEEEQEARLLEMSDELNFAKEDMTTIQKLKCGTHLEKIVYAKRLLKLLGFGDILARRRIGKEEMSQRLSRIRKTVLKSKYYQHLFGKLPEKEDLLLRWVNTVLRKVFGCFVKKSCNRKEFCWLLSFTAPWICCGEKLETKTKVSEKTRVPVF